VRTGVRSRSEGFPRDLGILQSEKRDLGGPGEGFSRDLETPEVRNGFRAQRGVAQEELRVLRVGCQSEKRLAKDFLRLRMVSAFTSSWLRLGLGGAGSGRLKALVRDWDLLSWGCGGPPAVAGGGTSWLGFWAS